MVGTFGFADCQRFVHRICATKSIKREGVGRWGGGPVAAVNSCSIAFVGESVLCAMCLQPNGLSVGLKVNAAQQIVSLRFGRALLCLLCS